eukprot:TRINITY_DN13364_c0_g1_i1.p1 TRINITY_DN13364_c0_g1~~TRINITY_DN13364_c0_g1_i1.p1  ORF type:complete len:255 (-),score=36.13 TRINITY_DN13364_c0_g1_i1:85-849(-)
MLIVDVLDTDVSNRTSRTAPGSCLPAWYSVGDGTCPTGRRVWLPFSSFTRPNEPTLLDNVAMVYSGLPLVIIGAAVLALVLRKNVRCGMMLIMPLLHEVMLPYLKASLQQPRPEGSCLVSCGMPSGHASFAIGLLTYIFCDLYFRKDENRVAQGVGAVVAFLPIPWSRYHLRDHSVGQLAVGAILGSVTCGVYFLVVRHFLCRRLKDDGCNEDHFEASVAEADGDGKTGALLKVSKGKAADDAEAPKDEKDAKS